MSRTNYYYDPPESLNIVNEPGECCNLCGKLARIMPAGSMVPLPMNAIHEEYGSQEGDIHGHLDCTENYMKELERELTILRANIKTFKKTNRKKA